MFIRARKRTLKNGQERRSFALIQAQRVLNDNSFEKESFTHTSPMLQNM